MISKKKIKIFLLDLLFTILLISLLVGIRIESKKYFEQVQSFSPEVTKVQELVNTKEASEKDLEQADQTLNTIDNILSKSLWLNSIFFPLGIFLLWILLEGLVWNSLTGIKFKMFVLYSLLPTLLFFSFTLYFLQYLSLALYNDTTASLFLLLGLAAFLGAVIYFTLISFVRSESLKNNFNIAKKNLKRLILPLLFLLFSLIVYLFLIILIFIFSYVQVSFILPGILLFFVIVLLNYQREYYIKKVKEL